MAKLSRNLSVGLIDPRENLFITGTLGALNAEVQSDCDGASTVSLDLRGTFVATVQVQGTVDGTNWVLIPIRNSVGGAYSAGATAAGVFMGACFGYRKVRAIATAYTSGAATTVLMASNAMFDDFARNAGITPLLVTATGAASAAVTLTLPAPGAGLRQYLTYLRITRFASALLTAAATPVLVTTTGLPGTPVFSLPAEAAAQGTVFAYQEDFVYPLAASAQNATLTVVCPVTTGVIWRVTGGYFVAP